MCMRANQSGSYFLGKRRESSGLAHEVSPEETHPRRGNHLCIIEGPSHFLLQAGRHPTIGRCCVTLATIGHGRLHRHTPHRAVCFDS